MNAASIMREIDALCVKLADLGASPAELDHNPESDRPHAMIDHDGTPEMRTQERDNT